MKYWESGENVEFIHFRFCQSNLASVCVFPESCLFLESDLILHVICLNQRMAFSACKHVAQRVDLFQTQSLHYDVAKGQFMHHFHWWHCGRINFGPLWLPYTERHTKSKMLIMYQKAEYVTIANHVPYGISYDSHTNRQTSKTSEYKSYIWKNITFRLLTLDHGRPPPIFPSAAPGNYRALPVISCIWYPSCWHGSWPVCPEDSSGDWPVWVRSRHWDGWTSRPPYRSVEGWKGREKKEH